MLIKTRLIIKIYYFIIYIFYWYYFNPAFDKPITNTAWVRTPLCKLQKRVHSTQSASDQVYQLLAHGRWFSPVTPASSTTKTGHHDIAEILLKVALNTQNQSINPAFEPGIIINNLSGRFNLCYCDSELDDILLVSSKPLSKKSWNQLSLFVCLFGGV